ncbi:cobyrinate a,c-diamide synthase [Pseudoroseicyclus tamaricis]|uniref:Hydrogenobyrinate a,c-diamide synthase n=1 Tax=Pseudoroseicyclus tamaricis TaxID=2705421 RepID=A0A6B2JRI6_9RHOB|nr:cobyrinate a,c-diamide synthase [Pseudoroseicyclus tamaricis]NDV00798.1 cobyrinate a,c-diamide synthase [Pseudoroseicyclus tamaricis]
MTRGLLIAAPSSGAGKTTVTLGMLRALARAGVEVRGAKSGPDYIDPAFHAAATGRACGNLDAWAMAPGRLRARAGGGGLLVIEGAMGLFDGAPPEGRGSAAELAKVLGAPVVLVVDAGRMAGSVAALVSGFAGFDPGVRVTGVILNRVGSDRHERMLRGALAPLGVPVLGALRRDTGLAHPSRHLGLVQAGERPDLEAFLERAADAVSAAVDLSALEALAEELVPGEAPRLTPPGQRIAVARDEAFAFAYPHVLEDWRAAGAELAFFSPLADEAVPAADVVFLPGGYPELHAGRLAGAPKFINSLRNAAETSDIYGECGGYMTLGDGLVDAEGLRHAMVGLLRLETSFAERRLHLGYREVRAGAGPMAGDWAAHEFHYATTLYEKGMPLFEATDAEGTVLPPMGLRAGRVCGSFAHLIDRRLPPAAAAATAAS